MGQASASVPDVSGYEIDDLIVDLGRQRVTRDGNDVPLPHLSFALLVTLAQAAPHFVSFDQLTERVWPGLVIAPETISQRVKLLREALGDDAHAPRYIAGIRGRGYRMVATVRPIVERPESHAPAADAAASFDAASSSPPSPARDALSPIWRFNRVVMAILGVLALGLGYVVIDRFWISKRSVVVQPVAGSRDAATVPVGAFSPPPHSIAVLPFVNMSGDKDQEYFSDGLTEELLNSLSRINELQVAAHTSSFYFKGKDVDLPTIAHKLNVASILEGSVRRSGPKVRVTAQLNNAVTGFHLWSQTYDRDLSDVLQLQADIASAVANALKVMLLGDISAKVEVGGTRNPDAFDAYLRASKTFGMEHGPKEMQAAIASYDEAVRLDPNYALAFADRAIAVADYAVFGNAQARHDALEKAQADARKAIELAPDLMESHRALGFVLRSSLDFRGAAKEYERALALNSGNARLLRIYGSFAVYMGWTDAGLAALRRAVVLDPLSRNQHEALASALFAARRYDESTAAYRDALTLDPDDPEIYLGIGVNYWFVGNYQSARWWCEAKPYPLTPACLAGVYDKLGRHSDAEAALAKFRASTGDMHPYINAVIYAARGDTVTALEWLEKAMRIRDSALDRLKTEPFFDHLRNQPRFQAIERELKFP